MARYIDAVKLVKAIEENQRNTEHHKDGHSKQIHVSEHRHFIKMVHESPTADVVPREEVENLKVELAKKIFDDLEASICVHAFTSKSEDYIEGACDTMDWVDSKLAELKKKYTEGKEQPMTKNQAQKVLRDCGIFDENNNLVPAYKDILVEKKYTEGKL